LDKEEQAESGEDRAETQNVAGGVTEVRRDREELLGRGNEDISGAEEDVAEQLEAGSGEAGEERARIS